jgi:hypothetical protein
MPTHPVLRGIEPDEIRAQSTADGHIVVVTDKLLRVRSEDRLVLDVAIDNRDASSSTSSAIVQRLW